MKKLIRALMFCMVMSPAVLYAQEAVEATTGDLKGTLVNALVMALVAFATALTGVLGTFLGKLLNRKIKDIDNDLYQKAAYVGVRWILDAGKKLTGTERYNKVMKQMVTKFPGAEKDDLDAAVRSMFVNARAELGNVVKPPTKSLKK